MIESRIECLCFEITIPGVGLLKRGQVLWIGESVSRTNPNVEHARQIGAVSVRYAERCQVSRQPLPARLKKHAKLPTPNAPAAPAVPPAEDVAIMAREFARAESVIVRADVASMVRETTREVLHREVVPHLASVIREELSRVSNTVVNNVSIPKAAPSDEPVFIPSNLVPADSAGITLKSEESSSGSLDDASEALRGLAKPKGPKGSKKPKAALEGGDV